MHILASWKSKNCVFYGLTGNSHLVQTRIEKVRTQGTLNRGRYPSVESESGTVDKVAEHSEILIKRIGGNSGKKTGLVRAFATGDIISTCHRLYGQPRTSTVNSKTGDLKYCAAFLPSFARETNGLYGGCAPRARHRLPFECAFKRRYRQSRSLFV